ncbi:8-amino-7-oxononanoate synthase [Candidatus Nitrospira neomarina]|uniref:8-amino-7-ketopelargonate synthase n=1 Tax=Candidatus Nitrospira neomarina TaxID=3020899 RepID=A0AA96K2Y9_9BACT|nr:8-amino-7-oxononanoate synthase [Candidatus Nitrospira neomarina]WNM62024.1 8-amino-7-oxononanoate synthase [Candidatus Nitrospira neomarina]
MFKEDLQTLAQQHLLRELSLINSPSAPVISVEGQEVLLFASNNYLGLANHPQVKDAAIKAIEKFGVGSGASRLISGNVTPHHVLEDELASFKETEAALTFSSGYATNLGVIPNLARADSLILADRLCHASLIDGCRLSRATLRVFHHNDVSHLKRLLTKTRSRTSTLILTEGVFSMDGDVAPLPEIAGLAEEYGATLLIDDAHGTGVMGATGRGTLEHFGLDSRHILQMGTLSKALGSSGGFIAGPKDFVAYLVNTARSFIYTTAPPPAIAAAASAALGVIRQEPQRRVMLWRNRDYLHHGLVTMGFQLTDTQSPILPIMVNDPEIGVQMSQHLRAEGVWIPAVRPPTVPKGTSRLRITVTADHSLEHLETALRALRKVGTALKVL